MKIILDFERQFDFFLAKDKQGSRIEYFLNRKASVKDIIECLGVPHTEVGHIYYNRQEIDFSFIPFNGGIFKVQTIPLPFNVRVPSYLRPEPLMDIRFIADANVIKLGRLLILLGFDVACYPSYPDKVIADIAGTENRIVLTRDTDLLKRNKIVFARRIRADLPYDQLVETIRFFGLEKLISFFSRCTACNIKLETVAKKEVVHLLEPKTKRYFHTFFQCPQCKNIFWKGSHYDNIIQKISSIGISIND